MTITPMTIEEIKKFVHACASCRFPDCEDCPEGLSIALAWATAEARARYWEREDFGTINTRLAEVLAEIGWPEVNPHTQENTS